MSDCIYIKYNSDWEWDGKFKYGYVHRKDGDENLINRLCDSLEEHSELSKFTEIYAFEKTKDYKLTCYNKIDEIISLFAQDTNNVIKYEEKYNITLPLLRKLNESLFQSNTKQSNEFIYETGIPLLKQIMEVEFPLLELKLVKIYTEEEINEINKSSRKQMHLKNKKTSAILMDILKRECNKKPKVIKEIETLEQNLETKNKELIDFKKTKGSQCSVEGSKYEKTIHNLIKHCYINNKPFNTQKEDELAGSSSKNDIECNFITKNDIGIEVKKYKTPDWMQCSIKYNKENKCWEAAKKGKNPSECGKMFDELINGKNLYDGEIPPFMERPITHEEWVELKKKTKKWDDTYIDIPSDYISKLYQAKGCNYIQISNGYGLYHLGNDICGFNVPLFNIEQQLRIRTKIHKRKNKKGFCNLSITIACQPKDITNLNPSKYTLDDVNNLPTSLIYKS
jgi:hypothetical protein